MKRATSSACRQYHIAPSDREDAQQDIVLRLLEMRPRYEARGGAPFGAYAWKGLVGAVATGLHRGDGFSPADWKRGRRRPRQFAEGEAATVAITDTAYQSVEIRDTLDQISAPFRRLGGLLEKIHKMIHLEGHSIRDVAESLNISRDVVRRLKVHADRIAWFALKRIDGPKRVPARSISNMEVQMDRYAKLEAALSQLRAEAHLLIHEFGGVFDIAALRNHFQAIRAIFDAGDSVTASQVCRHAARMLRLHRDLVKLSLQLAAERNAARVDERQLRFIFG